ncbi:MAG: S41 family peptidase [Dehalococcoidia bacterium]|nr:S41 family peptidase [Dehalococcoidia bacterium]
MLRTLKITLVILALVILASIFFVAGFGLARMTAPAASSGAASFQVASDPDYFKVFWEAWGITEKNFVDPKALDPQTMTRGAIKGMLDSLGDPHTGFVDPQHYQFEQADLQGSFEGIGAELSLLNQQLVVVAPMEGSPASKAGIRPRDRILQIDGQDATSMTVTQAVSKIRGQRGTTVTLLVLHEGDRSPTELSIVRDQIKTPSVAGKVLPDDVGYLRLAVFSDTSTDELKAALNNLLAAKVRSVILDLRSNPGGLLDQAIDITSQFLKEGVVAYQVDKDGKRTTYGVKPGGIATDVPLVVLVNKGSASASEILAGALQDRSRATVIGEQTFGKGSVNRFFTLSDGSALYVSFARWLTPNGRLIEGKGLQPDIVVAITDADRLAGRDSQLDRALDYVKNGK